SRRLDDGLRLEAERLRQPDALRRLQRGTGRIDETRGICVRPRVFGAEAEKRSGRRHDLTHRIHDASPEARTCAVLDDREACCIEDSKLFHLHTLSLVAYSISCRTSRPTEIAPRTSSSTGTRSIAKVVFCRRTHRSSTRRCATVSRIL